MIEHSLEHALTDSLKVLPFLFITYLCMEYLEKKTNQNTNIRLKRAGKKGILLGAVVGVIPQCGMSAVASNLYAGRMITAGTLIAVFLSTSDEMLPILISNSGNMGLIVKILALKIGIAMIGGLLTEYIVVKWLKGNDDEHGIHEFCEHEHCHCEDGIMKSAIRQTIRIFFYIFVITVVLNVGIEVIGEEKLGNFILNRVVLGPVLAGIVGLIPNCASSIVITKMFLEGFMSLGTMMAGLLVGAGVGILVLFRVNENRKESIILIGTLYTIGVLAGVILNLVSFPM